jgi:predicted small lipoprotein YifL
MPRSIRLTLAALVLAALAGCGGVGPDRSGAGEAIAPTTTTKLPLTTAPATAGPAYDTPAPSHFRLEPKVLERESFGTAGWLITVRVQAGWTQSYDPAKTYELTYELRGDEDGPEEYTIEVQGDEYEAREHTLATPRRDSPIRVRVLSVEEV